jgi:alpha-beta hydrolase superfamily lysophospholipase
MAKEVFIEAPDHDELVVILHGLNKSPTSMKPVVDAARSARPNADILAPPLPIGGWFGMLCFTPAEVIAARVVDRIQLAVDARAPKGYARIFLTGHSFGGVLARKVAIIAHGEQRDAPFEARIAYPQYQNGRDWAGAIERIVLLSAMSRGWLPESTRTWWEAVKWNIGSLIAAILSLLPHRNPSIMDIRRGMPFIVQTRLQWLALAAKGGHIRQARLKRLAAALDDGEVGSPGDPTAVSPATSKMPVIQLLGTVDDLVSPNDSVDLAVDTANNAPFKLIEVPQTNHKQATAMRAPTEQERKALRDAMAGTALPDVCKQLNLGAQVRWLMFERALSESLEQMNDIAIDTDYFADMPTISSDTKTHDFVFVIHGIRDRGFWTQKIARTIKREAARATPPRTFLSFTGSYGYFAMVPFLLKWVRKWKAAWLMDQYVEVKARFPDAEFCFVGHSNGTYLLASILQDYPSARFGRVVFAGSVVRRDFPWDVYLTSSRSGHPPRVKEVLNYVATGDWVVAIFPKGFQILKSIFDIGSAGHDGFDEYRVATPGPFAFLRKICRKPAPLPTAPLREARCIIGDHAAGIAETQWDDIARFIIDGTIPAAGPNFAARRSGWLVALGWVSPLILLVGIWIIVGVGFSLFLSITGNGAFTVADLQPDPMRWARWANDAGASLGAGAIYVATHFCEIIRSVGQWIWNAGHGRIVTYPVSDRPLAPGEVARRAAVFVAYIWVVYLLVSRF